LLHVTILFTLLDLQSTVKIKHTAGRFSTFHDSRRPVNSIYLPHRFISQSLPPKELGVFPSQRSCAPSRASLSSTIRRAQSGDIRTPPSIDSINKQVNMHTKSFRTLKCTSIPNSPMVAFASSGYRGLNRSHPPPVPSAAQP